MDPHSEQRLNEINPSLADRIRRIAAALSLEGIEIRVTQALRSWNMQQELWQQGRDAQGKVIGRTVTNAPPGHSWHEFGLAVDVAPFVNGQPDWDLSHPAWQRIIDAGKSAGLVSGSCFHNPDAPHLQLTGEFPLSPTDEVRQIFRDAGMEAVWIEAGLAPRPPKAISA